MGDQLRWAYLLFGSAPLCFIIMILLFIVPFHFILQRWLINWLDYPFLRNYSFHACCDIDNVVRVLSTVRLDINRLRLNINRTSIQDCRLWWETFVKKNVNFVKVWKIRRRKKRPATTYSLLLSRKMYNILLTMNTIKKYDDAAGIWYYCILKLLSHNAYLTCRWKLTMQLTSSDSSRNKWDSFTEFLLYVASQCAYL